MIGEGADIMRGPPAYKAQITHKTDSERTCPSVCVCVMRKISTLHN